MEDDHISQHDPEEIGHEIGEHNIEVLGLDIHNPVFAISALLSVALVILTMLFQERAAVIFGDLRTWITSAFDWFFMIAANIFVVFGLGLAISKLGRVRLGGPDAKPRYGYPG